MPTSSTSPDLDPVALDHAIEFAGWIDTQLVASLTQLGQAATADEISSTDVMTTYRRLAGVARDVAPKATSRPDAPRAVVMVTPTNAHTLAADLLARLLAGEGYRVDSLHPADLDGDLFGGNPPQIVAVSVGLESEWRGLPAYLAEIRDRAPRALILVGGAAVRMHRHAILPHGAVPCLGFVQALRLVRRRAPSVLVRSVPTEAAASM